MLTFEYKLENLIIPDDDILSKAGSTLSDILYFDIETTGLSRDNNRIYLIGIGYYSEKASDKKNTADLNIIQWFAEDSSQEADIIRSFAGFISSYSAFINFNGNSFDTPFIIARARRHGINLNFDELKNIDLYTYVKPYKKLLGLNDLKQKTLELFLKINRTDLYSGGELIEVYKNYCKNINTTNSKSAGREISNELAKESKKYLDMLLLHNMEDVKNMHYLLPLINLNQLNILQISYVNHSICEYAGYDSSCKLSYEVIIRCSHNLNLDINFTSIINIDSGTYAVNYSKDRLCIRIPVKCDSLGYYFENYKDYYYLPNENMCVLKQVASGIAKESRENATKENCRITLNGKFIYAFNYAMAGLKKYKAAYNSKFEYIRLDDFEAMPDTDKTKYLSSIIKLFT